MVVQIITQHREPLTECLKCSSSSNSIKARPSGLTNFGMKVFDVSLIGLLLIVGVAEYRSCVIQHLSPPIVNLIGVDIKLFRAARATLALKAGK